MQKIFKFSYDNGQLKDFPLMYTMEADEKNQKDTKYYMSINQFLNACSNTFISQEDRNSFFQKCREILTKFKKETHEKLQSGAFEAGDRDDFVCAKCHLGTSVGKLDYSKKFKEF